jgi:hypothetical protein
MNGRLAACAQGAASLQKTLLPRRIGLAAALARICGLGLRIGLEKEPEEAVALNATAEDDIDRGPARHEAALRGGAQQ